jgi:5-methylcytosine-specific restriction endonuclease McrA
VPRKGPGDNCAESGTGEDAGRGVGKSGEADLTPQQERRAKLERDWEVMSDRILERDGRECLVCGGMASAVHHVLGRKYPSLFLDERYLAAICWNCNRSELADTVQARIDLLEKLANLYGYEYEDCPDKRYRP